MKSGQRPWRFLASSWILALFPCGLLLLFVDAPNIELIKIEPGASTGDQVFYVDLNGDGVSENIQAGRGKPPFHYLVVRDNFLRYYEQWNLRDSLDPAISKLWFTDIDHDNKKEILIFTINRDSVFLNVNEHFDATGIRINRLFITTISLSAGTNTSTIHHCGIFDRNADGHDELYFVITSGFGLEPRKVYSFDLQHNELLSSDFTGININDPTMTDVDGDNRPEIFGFMTASGNYHTPTPFSDYSTWLMVYDEQLRFKFPPIEYRGFANGLYVKPFRHKNQPAYLAAHFRNGADSSIQEPRIAIYDVNGKRVHERLIADFCAKPYSEIQVMQSADQIYMVLISNPVLVLDSDLGVVGTITLPFDGTSIHSRVLDFEGDGIQELFLYERNSKDMVVVSSKFQMRDHFPIDLPDDNWQHSYYNQDNEKMLFLKSGNKTYYLKKEENPNFWMSSMIYPAAYFLIVAFISAVKWINTKQLQRKENLRKELLVMQLQGLKTELDPHFTFNAMNSVASLLYLDDRKLAYDALNLFTLVLRQMLNDAHRIYRTLDDELRFVGAYLDFETLRLQNKFSYRIQVADERLKICQVPKLCIQVFVENAIKHAFPIHDSQIRNSAWELLIDVHRREDHIVIRIKDNGVGRSNSYKSPTEGTGIRRTERFYRILNEIHGRSFAAFRIEDLSPGTLVVVEIEMLAYEKMPGQERRDPALKYPQVAS